MGASVSARVRLPICIRVNLPCTPPPIHKVARVRIDDGKYGRVPLLDLEHHDCRWPTRRENDQHLFCGRKVMRGKVYCEHHYAKSVDRPSYRQRPSAPQPQPQLPLPPPRQSPIVRVR